MKTSNIFRNAHLLLLIISGILIIGACKKEESKKDYTYRCALCGQEALTDFLKDNSVQSQVFTFDASSQAEILGEQGTRISFGPNSFGDASGYPVSGEIEVSLKEIFKPGEMILSNRMTESNGQLLASGGELYLSVQQNGQDLQLINNSSVSVNVPASNPDTSMALFTGSKDSSGSFTWAPNPTPVRTCQDSLGNTTYCFDLYSLFNWINCDCFYNDPRPLTEVEIVVPQGFDPGNTKVFVYVPSINSMINVTNYQSQSFWIKGGYRVPVGLQVDFIGLHADSLGTLQYAYQSNSIVNNHREILNFKTITAQQLKLFLLSL